MRVAAYAGSFDPITCGHVAVAEVAAKMFDKLIIVVTANANKPSGRFSAGERVELAKASLAHLPNVEIVNIHGQYVARWAQQYGCGWLVRGLRKTTELDAERELELENARIEPRVQTVFIPAPLTVANVSSSLVASEVGLVGWHHAIQPLVPSPVLQAFLVKHLRNYYNDICSKLDGANFRSAEVIKQRFEALVVRYTEPHRHYHTLAHVNDVLEQLDLLAPANSETSHAAIRMAAFYHDFVNVGDGNDEMTSAELAEVALKSIGLSAWAGSVGHYVLGTEKCGDNQRCEKSPNIQTLVDADLSILGRPLDEYAIYAAQIRDEYLKYDDAQYAAGRIALVLEPLLAKPRIYRTQPFFDAYETQAKANLAWELARLRG